MMRLSLLCLLALLPACAPSQPAAPRGPASPPPGADAFLDDLEHRTFDFFWDLANPENGLIPDRAPGESFSSIAAVGFALTAYPIGVERGYVSRQAAADRTLTTLRFFWRAPHGPEPDATGYHGFYYHFLDMRTGKRFEKVELSTIDTSLLLAGVLLSQQYFDGGDAVETEIRALADSLYRRADWTWMQPRPPLVSMGWTPEEGQHGWDWHGLNEAMILYVLALGSPTHPIQPEAWAAYTGTYRWGTWYGQEHVGFGPLFGHQYSQLWIDPRGLQDAYLRGHGIDYFENARRATLGQRGYAIANPGNWAGYGEDIWGLSACDGPADGKFTVSGQTRTFHTYAARASSFTEVRDDGTICPTAAGSSMPFTPDESIRALMAMKQRYGDDVYSRYGFVDAFNETFTAAPKMGKVVPGKGWFDTQYLGIDQGPLLGMVENHRTGLVWKLMRRSPYVRRGLERGGFTGGWLTAAAER
ncbi:MAG TPA: glucoamylase family protein [Longimicrobiales bacterium]|nr:glucoamylase family protein [Longimicrobiales bacterium]